MNEVTMPAGDYVMGDPCYSVPDDRWMEWLEAAGYMEENRRILFAPIDGLPVLGIGTAYGDGVYPGSNGFDYPVDAGLIGLVPVEIAVCGWGTKVVTFSEPFECRYEDGDIVLGHVRIDTDPGDEL